MVRCVVRGSTAAASNRPATGDREKRKPRAAAGARAARRQREECRAVRGRLALTALTHPDDRSSLHLSIGDGGVAPAPNSRCEANGSRSRIVGAAAGKVEATMPEQSSAMHVYLNWAKERIDEMDATLASLAAEASRAKADMKAKADQMVVDLMKRRDEFQAKVNTQAQAGDAALQAGKAQLEAQWQGFETQVKTFFETVGRQVEQQQATFRDVAAAQARAWREAVDTLHAEAAKLVAARRTDIDAAVEQMKADADEAEARFQKLKQAGSESWAGLSAALTESRNAFDRANQQAWDAVKRAIH